MIEESTGGWLTPERKKAIVVSLYIWVPLGLLSLILWKFFPPHRGYIEKPEIARILPGFFVTLVIVLLWAIETKRRSALYGSMISALWVYIFGWGALTRSEFFDPIRVPVFHPIFWWFGVPVFICYIYNKKKIIRFTWDGYLAAAFFSLIVGFMGAVLHPY